MNYVLIKTAVQLNERWWWNNPVTIIRLSFWRENKWPEINYVFFSKYFVTLWDFFFSNSLKFLCFGWIRIIHLRTVPNTVKNPHGIAFDPVTKTTLIADKNNNRVIKYLQNSSIGEIVFISVPIALTSGNKTGALYIVYEDKDVVL